MSGDREPTLREVLAAVQGVQESLDTTKFEVMDRIDRVQDAVNEHRDDMTVLLGLISSNQAVAERGLSEARLAFDQHRSMAQVLAAVERQIRKLQSDLRELRGEPG